MHNLRILLYISGLIYLYTGYVHGIGINSLCSCVNPSGVCAILCMRQNFNNPIITRYNPIITRYNPIVTRVGPKQIVYVTETDYSTVTQTKTKTRHTIRTYLTTVLQNVPVTVERKRTVTVTPIPVTNTKIITEFLKVTNIETITVVPSMHSVTVKSIQVITQPPILSTVRVSVTAEPVIHVETKVITSIITPKPIYITNTTTSVKTVQVHPTLYKDYINVKPLVNDSGVLVEFHDSNNKVKTVRVILPHKEIFEKPENFEKSKYSGVPGYNPNNMPNNMQNSGPNTLGGDLSRPNNMRDGNNPDLGRDIRPNTTGNQGIPPNMGYNGPNTTGTDLSRPNMQNSGPNTTGSDNIQPNMGYNGPNTTGSGKIFTITKNTPIISTEVISITRSVTKTEYIHKPQATKKITMKPVTVIKTISIPVERPIKINHTVTETITKTKTEKKQRYRQYFLQLYQIAPD
ncbi:hypothetical protein NERG_02291 [Nematocida ausubeli]|uniref:Uncharacterized protein n=1 Tax=Nematocida ausubeli (strain ATCC PRA-371 / ERTm2) TaxID=1913371 RepID=H8ZFC0_NEMA1|nr:hypothetical protein NERG_02291 [Nematocida ausubeli]